jgi:transposase
VSARTWGFKSPLRHKPATSRSARSAPRQGPSRASRLIHNLIPNPLRGPFPGLVLRFRHGQSPPTRRGRQEEGNSPIQATRRQALGRSRGGLTTKLHTIADGRGRNLATRLTPGQDADTLQLVGLVDAVRVARPGGRGRPRKRLDHLTGDKAYSSRANRAALRARRIPHTIPERDDQKANRVRKGARGGRPPKFDRVRYKQRNQVERLMNRRKQFRAVATRYDTQSMMRPVRVTRRPDPRYDWHASPSA